VEEDQDPVSGKAVDRAFVPGDDRSHRRVVFAKHGLDLLRLGSVGERREAAEIGEHVAYFAAMRRQDRFLARRDDRVGDVRRKEALELTEALELGDLLI